MMAASSINGGFVIYLLSKPDAALDASYASPAESSVGGVSAVALLLPTTSWWKYLINCSLTSVWCICH